MRHHTGSVVVAIAIAASAASASASAASSASSASADPSHVPDKSPERRRAVDRSSSSDRRLLAVAPPPPLPHPPPPPPPPPFLGAYDDRRRDDVGRSRNLQTSPCATSADCAVVSTHEECINTSPPDGVGQCIPDVAEAWGVEFDLNSFTVDGTVRVEYDMWTGPAVSDLPSVIVTSGYRDDCETAIDNGAVTSLGAERGAGGSPNIHGYVVRGGDVLIDPTKITRSDAWTPDDPADVDTMYSVGSARFCIGAEAWYDANGNDVADAGDEMVSFRTVILTIEIDLANRKYEIHSVAKGLRTEDGGKLILGGFLCRACFCDGATDTCDPSVPAADGGPLGPPRMIQNSAATICIESVAPDSHIAGFTMDFDQCEKNPNTGRHIPGTCTQHDDIVDDGPGLDPYRAVNSALTRIYPPNPDAKPRWVMVNAQVVGKFFNPDKDPNLFPLDPIFVSGECRFGFGCTSPGGSTSKSSSTGSVSSGNPGTSDSHTSDSSGNPGTSSSGDPGTSASSSGNPGTSASSSGNPGTSSSGNPGTSSSGNRERERGRRLLRSAVGGSTEGRRLEKKKKKKKNGGAGGGGAGGGGGGAGKIKSKKIKSGGDRCKDSGGSKKSSTGSVSSGEPGTSDSHTSDSSGNPGTSSSGNPGTSASSSGNPGTSASSSGNPGTSSSGNPGTSSSGNRERRLHSVGGDPDGRGLAPARAKEDAAPYELEMLPVASGGGGFELSDDHAERPHAGGEHHHVNMYEHAKGEAARADSTDAAGDAVAEESGADVVSAGWALLVCVVVAVALSGVPGGGRILDLSGTPL